MPRSALWSMLLTVALLAAASSARAQAPRPPRRTVHAPLHAAAARPSAAARAAAATPAAPRRLEDVSIEGEVPVPQVLFVTAREQRRGIEFQHHRYLATGRALGEATPLPRWIATPQNPAPSR